VLVVGYGVHIAEANQQLRDLAEMWYLPVATSYKGKSTIAENHPLALSIVRVYGQPVANQVVGKGDTVIIVGANLSPQYTMRESPNVFNPHQQHIIQIDIEYRNSGWTFPIEVDLTSDAGSVMSQLIEASQQAAPKTASNGRPDCPGRNKTRAFTPTLR
jgi:thiamine pyrophosphate-dependent acetolactate synthase large subunit-like protein